jgi:F0F1-type ATP synthase assembly protein I
MADLKGRDPRFEGLRTAGLLLAIPALLIVSPLVGFFLGSLVDRWAKTSPWFTIVGLVLGFAAGGRETHLIYRRYLAEEEERNKRRRP